MRLQNLLRLNTGYKGQHLQSVIQFLFQEDKKVIASTKWIRCCHKRVSHAINSQNVWSAKVPKETENHQCVDKQQMEKHKHENNRKFLLWECLFFLLYFNLKLENRMIESCLFSLKRHLLRREILTWYILVNYICWWECYCRGWWWWEVLWGWWAVWWWEHLHAEWTILQCQVIWGLGTV